MRKLLSLIFVVSAIAAVARQVSPDEAAAIASDFLNSSSVQQASGRVTVQRAKAANHQTEAPFYVFNADENRGFVIVSGDDRARKILGYSDTGTFDFNNMPPQLAALLEQYAEQIEKLPASATTDPSWNVAAAAPASTEGVLLETANWGQGYPYNAQCPIIDGVQAPTGCVATAMAIVMKYHNWPENYNWDAMPVENINETNSSEIGRLMSDAGKSVFMNYTPYESGAHMNWVGHKLQQDFKYSSDCQFITAKNFSSEEWVEMLRSNLDNHQPVIYSGTDYSQLVSHAFVIDGYKGSEYHINWGWDGLCNGYFALTALCPDENQDYTAESGMVINIAPDKSGKEYSKCFIDYGYFYLIHGHELSVNNILNNITPSDFSVGEFNIPKGWKGDVALALLDKDGNIKEILQINDYDTTYPDADLISGYTLNFINILPSTIVNNDDIIAVMARDAGTQKWLKVLGTLETPCEKTIDSMTPKTIKITFDFDESEFMTEYWKGYNDDCYHQVKNGESIDFTYGLANIQLGILDVQSHTSYPDDKILIRIENATNGNLIEEWHSSMAAFSCKNDLVIHITSLKAENNETVFVETPGSLESLCTKIDPLRTGELHVKGNINAKDLWYIRDNFTNLISLDITEAVISACNEIDPKYSYNAEYPTEFPANTLPANGLRELSRLTYLGLPDNLESIQTESCSGLSLTAIELPKSLTVIESYAFNLDYNLSTIICRSLLPPTISDDTFANTNISVSSILICPDGYLQEYSKDVNWSNLVSEIISDSQIGLSDLSKEKDGIIYELIPFGSKITGYIQDSINREGITIPDIIIYGRTNRKVIEIAEMAFYYCLTKEIVLSDNIEKIGNSAFGLAYETERIILPSNLKEIPPSMCSGTRIKDIIIPESVELLSMAFDGCVFLEHFYIPQNAIGDSFYRNMIGSGFESMIEFDVHPDNSIWRAVDGLLYSKDKSTLFNCPGTKTGILDVCKETTLIESYAFDRCSNLSKIRFTSDQVHIGYVSMNIGYADIDNIEFPQNTYFSGTQCLYVDGLKSMTLGDFTVSIVNSIQCFPHEDKKLIVYLKNKDAVDFSETYMTGCSDWEYYISGLKNNVTVPENAQLYVPGKTKNIFSKNAGDAATEMWSYGIDREKNLLMIKPQIKELVIDNILVNGELVITNDCGIYSIHSADNLDVVVNYTLHGRQSMSTHYTPEFNAALESGIFIPGDVNEDGAIDGLDLNAIISYIAKSEGSTINLKAADMNEDGVIDGLDINTLITNIANKKK